MNFSVDLLGFDYLPIDGIYGFWVCGVKDANDNHNSLLCVHYAEGEFRVEFLFMRLY